MALVNILVPDIGDFSEVGVIELLVKAGDTVKVEQSLITVESDKASMEIPSSHAGVVKELKVALGDKVSQGSVIAVLDSAEAGASEEKPAPAPANQAPAATKPEAAAPVVAPAAAAASGPIEVRVPDIGDFKDVAVIELLVKPGDTIAPEQSLFTVESDKASMEIPSPAAGVLKELKVQLGDKVNQGDLVAIIEGAASAAVPAAAAPAPTPGDNRNFFEKLFGVQKQQPAGPALAYAAPQDDAVESSRGAKSSIAVAAMARAIAVRSSADCRANGSACGSRPSATMLSTRIGQWNSWPCGR